MKIQTEQVQSAALLLLAFLTLNLQPSTACAQGTAFTYQGQLQNSGSPANGTYNLTFSLYTTNITGVPVAGPVTTNGVVITNGLFTVTMDFGSGVWNGATNWLEIGVETNGATPFKTLAPRQQLTPVPYAIFAEGVNAAGLTGTVPPGSVPDSSLSPDVALLNATQTFTGVNSFSRNLMLNGNDLYLLGASSSSPGGTANYGLGYRTSVAGISPSGGDGPFLYGFDSGYLGTRSPDTVALWWDWHGNVWVSNNLATATLSVQGGMNLDQANYNQGYLNNGSTNGYGLTFGSGSGEGIASQRQVGAGGNNQYGLDFYTDFTKRMSINNSGFVGIGTQTQILGDEQFGMYSSTSNNFSGMYIGTAAGGRPFYGFYEGGYPSVSWTEINGQQGDNWELWLNNSFKMAVTTNGNVGIGTATPGSALEVANGSIRTDAYPLLCNTSGSGVFANDGLYNGTLGLTNTIGISEGDGPGLWGYFGGSLGALAPNTIALSWDSGGDIWVSNNCSVATLTSRYGVNIDQANLDSGGVSANTLTFGLSSGEGIGSQRTGGSTGNGLDGLEFYTSFARRMTILQDGNVGIGSTNPANLLVVGGATSPAYCNGTSWVNGSDRNSKQDFATVNPRDVLEKVSALPITEWQYKIEPGEEHIGPMAQDFHAAFGLNGGDDKHISTVDEGGVALAAIQGLNQKLQEKDAKIQQQAKEIAQLQQQFAELNFLVKQLVQPQSK